MAISEKELITKIQQEAIREIDHGYMYNCDCDVDPRVDLIRDRDGKPVGAWVHIRMYVEVDK